MGIKIVGGFLFPTHSQCKELFAVGMSDMEDYAPPSKGPWWIGGVLFGT